ncbi:MAG: AmmeMemoRadiSam system protein A [Syntrophales bacterium]|jgi:AmmeMemoRadiSam system protein A
MGLTEEEKKSLLKLAKSTVESKLTNCELYQPPITSPLKEKRGLFVTIKEKGQLRGCIGYIQEVRPLCEAVSEMAGAAAFRDPRFSPVCKEEIPSLSYEISVLTPMKEITGVEEIEIGVHGLYISKGYHSGLLLPQVATEYHWDPLTFLEQTCYKAGLPADAWKDEDTKVFVFSADVFSEESC